MYFRYRGAQAVGRYLLENPMANVDSFLTGIMTIPEGCRHHQIEQMIYSKPSASGPPHQLMWVQSAL